MDEMEKRIYGDGNKYTVKIKNDSDDEYEV